MQPHCFYKTYISHYEAWGRFWPGQVKNFSFLFLTLLLLFSHSCFVFFSYTVRPKALSSHLKAVTIISNDPETVCHNILISHYNIVLFRILLSLLYSVLLCMLAALAKRNIYMPLQCSNSKLDMSPLFKKI